MGEASSVGLAYYNLLEGFKRDFLECWEKQVVSNSQGLKYMEHFKTLGAGSFGTVLLVRYKPNKVFYAMKVLEKKKIIKLKQLEHSFYELKMLECLRFPFIIHLEMRFKDNSYIYLVMPFINGGDMFNHLRRLRRFDESLARFYASQVVLALEYMHYCDVLYRDLKPENIVLDSTGYLKITDLGFCKIVKGRTWTLCGTPEYIAPEILLSKGYGKAVDWWSFGVLLYEMVAGYPPFTANEPMKIYEKIISGKYRFGPNFSGDLKDLIYNILQIDLTKRYGNLRKGVQDIKMHRWFKQISWTAIYNRAVVPSYKPVVNSPADASNFSKHSETQLRVSVNDRYKQEFQNF